jgi:hypothetical protein
MFAPRNGFEFVQHGWVVLSAPAGAALCGYICDPTRWVFEGAAPYIFWGKNNGEYDEGGNKLRTAMRGSPPAYDPDDKQYEISTSVMDSKTWSFVEKYLDINYTDANAQPVGVLSVRQIAYLAHADPVELGMHVVSVFDAINKLELGAFIPIDNKRMIERLVKGGRDGQ